MRDRAQEADIVVVNHHLFFADLSLRNGTYGSVLPDYTAVILDEAHLVEEVASEYFGAQVSNYQIDDLVRDLGMLVIEDAEVDRELTKSTARMSQFSEDFWMGFRDGRGEDGRYPILPGTFARKNSDGELEATRLGELFVVFDGALERAATTLDTFPDKPPEIDSLIRRMRQIRFELQFIVTGADKKFVYWLERRHRGIFLRASPIDVAGLLQDKLFEEVPTVVLTSATLSSGGNFAFIRDRLGLDTADDLIAESSFDYESQAILYLPAKMPDPRDRNWAPAAADEVIRILNATEGRAFVLSTSLAGMQYLFETRLTIRAWSREARRRVNCSSGFERRQTRCCLRPRVSGRASTCVANSCRA
jgi:ATP-dependent DNA helicase DinG